MHINLKLVTLNVQSFRKPYPRMLAVAWVDMSRVLLPKKIVSRRKVKMLMSTTKRNNLTHNNNLGGRKSTELCNKMLDFRLESCTAAGRAETRGFPVGPGLNYAKTSRVWWERVYCCGNPAGKGANIVGNPAVIALQVEKVRFFENDTGCNFLNDRPCRVLMHCGV